MDAEKASETNPGGCPVAFLCRVLKVSRSAYYAWRAAKPARGVRQRAEDTLVAEIRVLHAGSRGAYGVPRIHAALRRAGRAVNAKRVERLMREHRIVGITRRRRRVLTRQAKRAVFAADLIGRDFTAPRPGTKIVGNITYIPTAGGRLCLASWLDLATRVVVGYSMADHHRAGLVVDALDMAAALGRLEPGCVIHSDRGSEYTSRSTAQRNSRVGFRQSMGRTGSCFGNAAAESFRAVLKEGIGPRFWPDRATARADIFDFVETFYNRRRLRKHIHWGHLTPHETRLRHQQDQALAA
ncbi:IS3 family transposase [Streptomyces sp. NPDC058625]|uniref:IS3 family transposase n=1 Tax=Streptomyces sp. NPDC058625 TaxID=3346564 RepID=UPI00364DC937